MDKLSARALNRATLQRQWLIERQHASALDAVEHLVAMQAQVPLAPYVGLWSRLTDFRPTELAELLESRRAVRGSMLRATIHLMSARDFLAFRGLIQPRLEREVFANVSYGRHRLEGFDLDEVLAYGQELMAVAPRSAAELRNIFAERWPDRHAAALAHAVRCLLPTIQIPPRGIWGKGGNPIMSTASLWLGADIERKPSIDDLVLRYFAAFGPASVADLQTWCGLTRLSEVVDRLRPRLRTYVDEASGRELFDLATIELPPEDLPVPVRFLPEFDNILFSYADRTRIIDQSNRNRIVAERLGVGTVLYDGTVAAFWKTTRPKPDEIHLQIDPAIPLTPQAHHQIHTEAESLAALYTPTATVTVTQ